ncbi:MAG: hypothetical protein QNJ60_10295 [Xenococcaceae cyanobacterium MO_188.B19]|nr:hypothetical protein [Xenococcaceae cyanobacterium MO_188.B19]
MSNYVQYCLIILIQFLTLELEEVIVQLEMVSRQKRNQHLTNQASSS